MRATAFLKTKRRQISSKMRQGSWPDWLHSSTGVGGRNVYGHFDHRNRAARFDAGPHGARRDSVTKSLPTRTRPCAPISGASTPGQAQLSPRLQQPGGACCRDQSPRPRPAVALLRCPAMELPEAPDCTLGPLWAAAGDAKIWGVRISHDLVAGLATRCQIGWFWRLKRPFGAFESLGKLSQD